MNIRTISGAVAFIHKADPGSAITAHYIRRLVREGCIPYMQNGTRILVDVDTLLAYFESTTSKVR